MNLRLRLRLQIVTVFAIGIFAAAENSPDRREFDFAGLEGQALPAEWSLWRQDEIGSAVIAGAGGWQNSSCLRIRGARSAACQYDLPVAPGQIYRIEALRREDGTGKASMAVAWKDADRKWRRHPARQYASFRPHQDGWHRSAMQVTIPDQVRFLTLLLGATGQTSADDDVFFDQVIIERQKLAEQQPVPADEEAPHLNVELTADDYRPWSRHGDVLQTLRMGVLKHNIVPGDEKVAAWITPENADAYARTMRDSGYNVVLTEGQRFLMNDGAGHAPYRDVCRGSLPFPQLIENTRAIAEACRRQNLKVYLHLTGGLAAPEFRVEHPDWLVRGINDNDFKSYWGLEWFCQNNPDYRREYNRRLDLLLATVKPDGLMIDETSNMYDSCGCPHCRRRFAADTGLAMPAAGEPWFGDRQSPVYRRFLDWRLDCHVRLNADFQAMLRRQVADGVMMTYYAVPNNENAWADHGISLETAATVGDAVGLEAISNYDTCWALFVANLKLTRAAAEPRGGVTYFIKGYGNYNQLFNFWLLSLSQLSHQYWTWYMNDQFKEWRRPLIQWEMKHQNILAGNRSAGEVGVVFSSLNNHAWRQPRGMLARQNSFVAMSNTLTLAGIPHQALLDLDLNKPLAGRTKVIFAMNVAVLTEPAVENLRQFVAAGGTLIASSETSLADAHGDPKANFALADVFGCDFEQTVEGTGRLRMEHDFPGLDALVEVRPHPAAEVLGTIHHDATAKPLPGLLRHRYGRGRAYYFAGSIEPLIYCHELNGNQIAARSRDDQRDVRMEAFLKSLLASSGLRFAFSGLPPGVVTEAYRHDFHGTSGWLVVLFNGSGLLRDGRPEKISYAYPPVAAGATVTVRDSAIRRVTAWSPDWPQPQKLTLARTGEGVTVSLPPLKHVHLLFFETSAP